MDFFLNRVDAVPVAGTEFTFEFEQWITNLVDVLNEDLGVIQDQFTLLPASSYTSAEITDLAPNLQDGVLLYDTDLDVYVGRQAGALVKFTTTAYP